MKSARATKTNQTPKAGADPARTRQTATHPGAGHPLAQLQRRLGNRGTEQFVQARLKISQPNDPYEQEADRVAEAVMRMPDIAVDGPPDEEAEPAQLQRKPLAAQITPLVQRQADPEAEEEEIPEIATRPAASTTLQRQAELEAEEDDKLSTGAPKFGGNNILQRQEIPEEEEIEPPVSPKLMGSGIIQRQEVPEEEEETETLVSPKLSDNLSLQRQQKPEEVEEEIEEPLQRKPASGSTTTGSSNLSRQIQSMKGGGQPLSDATRSFFEPRFGANFERVRIHSDSNSAEMARSINAKAFTSGSDIVFNRGQYAPESDSGKELLAHELTHVVQQRNISQIDHSKLQRQGGGTTNTPDISSTTPKAKVYPPIYWSFDPNKQKAVARTRAGVTLEEVAQFLYGDPTATKELASVNKIDPTAVLTTEQILELPVKQLTKTASRHMNESPKIPLFVKDQEAFMLKKRMLDSKLGQDFSFIVAKLDELHYSDADEGEVINILKKWGQEDFTTNPKLYPQGGEYLDKLFDKLKMKSKDVGIVSTQMLSYYSVIFNKFDRVKEVKAIRDIFSRKYKGDSGIKEISFGGDLWEEVKSGAVRDRIFAYFKGMGEAVIGLLEGLYHLVTDPIGTLKSIGELPETLSKLWDNREKLWKDFLNAEPTEQARMIGRLFGEAEILIATFGAGSEGNILKAPEMATAVEFVMGQGGTLAMLPGKASAISINMAQLGIEATRMSVLTSKTAELAEKGEKKAESLAKAPKVKSPKLEVGNLKAKAGVDPYSNFSIRQLRKLARKDPEAMEALRLRFRAMYDADPAKLKGYARRGDPMAQSVLESKIPPNTELKKILTSEKRYLSHEATVTARDASGKIIKKKKIKSGNMTPDEAALKYPASSLETHTEARALRQMPLERGGSLRISGQYDPCNSCIGKMRRAAKANGVTIYYWWPGGKMVFRP